MPKSENVGRFLDSCCAADAALASISFLSFVKVIVAPDLADCMSFIAFCLFAALILSSELRKYRLPEPVLTTLPSATAPFTIGDVSTLSPSSKFGEPYMNPVTPPTIGFRQRQLQDVVITRLFKEESPTYHRFDVSTSRSSVPHEVPSWRQRPVAVMIPSQNPGRNQTTRLLRLVLQLLWQHPLASPERILPLLPR